MAPILAICIIVCLALFGERPVAVCICLAIVAFGVLDLFTMGFSQEFYNLVQVLAPASFISALVGFAEIAIRKTEKHFLTACFALGLSLAYWIFTVGLTAVVG